LPLFDNWQVSDSVGPLTPKLAVATVGRVTESIAEAEPPPYEPLMVPTIVPPTALVEMMNVALVDPPGTVTLGGTVSASPVPVDKETTAPPAGAAPVSVAVPVTWFPPTTLFVLSEIEESAGPEVTVNVGDLLLLPLNDAVIVAVPAATPNTANVALEEPAGIMTDVGTVATAGLLLDSEILAPPVDAAAERVTVPCPLLPAAMLVLMATLDTPGIPFVAPVGDPELPH
jgi:hypothetical protein